MALVRGCLGRVEAGPSNEVVVQLNAWEYQESAERIDVSVMGNCDKAYIAGAVETSGSFTCHHDVADAGQALLLVGAQVQIVLYPGGNASGEQTLTATVTITGVSKSADVNAAVSATYQFSLVGSWTQGTVP